MPVFPPFIGGPSRGLDAQTIVSLAKSKVRAGFSGRTFRHPT